MNIWKKYSNWIENLVDPKGGRQKAKLEAIIEACRDVAIYLRSDLEEEEVSTYRDDKLIVTLDYSYDNYAVRVYLKPAMTEVFCWKGDYKCTFAWGNVPTSTIYRRGAWEKYLLDTLAPKAHRVREDSNNTNQEREDMSFHPSDDEDLFKP